MQKENNIPENIRLKLRDLLPRFVERITVYRYGDWLSPSKLAKAKKLLEGESNASAVLNQMRQRTKKSRATIIYGLQFKSGYFRAIWFDTKNETWISKADNESEMNIGGKSYDMSYQSETFRNLTT